MEAGRGTPVLVALALLTVAVPALASDPWPVKASVCASPTQTGCLSPYEYEHYLYLDSLAGLPDDYSGGTVWKYSSAPSGFPEIDNDPRELNGVTGMSIDRAWLRSTGRPDVVIAVLDSGIRWGEPDLRLKAFLNRGELPVPLASTNPIDPYDTDFNGAFDVADYAGEAADANGNGGLDAQDLILAYTDGVDDDANGFVDDVSGWNFLDDTNDPFDEVDFGHGTGEAEDSTGEAGNGGGFPGVCPSCRFIPLRVGESFVAHSEDYAQAVVYAVDIGAAVVQEALGTIDWVRLVPHAHRYAWDHGVPLIASAADEAAFHHNFPSGADFTINVNSIRTGGDLAPAPRSYLYLNGCTNFGGNVWVSVSSTSCSSEATGRSAGIAALLESHARNLAARGQLAPHPDAASFPSGNVLSAAEVRQLFRAGADDIDLSTKREVASPVPTVQYASQPGWDQYSGWGRINAERALALVDQGMIPPEAAIVSPSWWSSHDALQGAALGVGWEASAHRAMPGTARVTVGFGCGVQPLVFHGVADAPLATGASGTATVPLLKVAAACGITPRVPVGPNDFTVTLRLAVDATNPLGSGPFGVSVHGEDRRTIQLTMDPTLAPGWPKLLEGSQESSADVVDLDGDGFDEILVSTASGVLHALRADGTELPGFPVHTGPMPGLHTGGPAFTSGALAGPYYDSFSQGATAIGDLDGDGDLEIVATTLNGRVHAWDSTGAALAGFPVGVDPAFSLPQDRDEHNTVIRGFEAAPTLADLDGDDQLEIVAAAMDRHVYAWRNNGQAFWSAPVHLADTTKVDVDPVTHRVTPKAGVATYRGAQIVSTTAIGDLDGDGSPEIVVGANEHYPEPLAVTALSVTSTVATLSGLLDVGNGRLYALHADGSPVAGFPVRIPDLAAEVLPYVGEGVPGSPALGDLDGDGKDEIAIFATAGPVMVLRGDGSSFYGDGPDGLPLPLSMEMVGPFSGAVDVPLLPGLGSGAIGALLPGSPAVVAPAIGLGRALDVALPGEQLVSQDYVQAWDARTGLVLPAWPRPIEDFQFITTPAIINVDADPLPEVVEGSGGYLLQAWDATGAPSPGFPKATNHWLIGTAAVGDIDGDGLRELVATSREGWVWVWKTQAVDALSTDEWWSDHHDEANTGRWTGPALAGDSAATAPAPMLGSVAGLLAVLGLAWLRRRD